MIRLTIHGAGASLFRRKVHTTVFKGGEVNIILPSEFVSYLERCGRQGTPVVELHANLTDSNEVMAFFMTVDALHRVAPAAQIHAVIPYLPYARQDRVCNPGEALSLAMFAKMVNALELASVELIDPHSDVSGGLIERSVVTGQLMFMRQIIERNILSLDVTSLYLVAPDAGAVKKIKKLSDELTRLNDIDGYFTASKVRNPATMEITGTHFDGDVKNKNLIVVDDICDGGRTFIQLGKKLKEAGCMELSLFVTHGIFSYGLDELMSVYDRVYTTDSFHPDMRSEVRKHSETFINERGLHRFYWFTL